ncbi:MAG: FAD-dependent oxidoreductase [Burkholderiales bacterium]
MSPHVLIAGGGIGGMAAALALLRAGMDVDVYEQARALREVGAGVQISANGNRTLYALGLQQAIEALAVETQGKEIRLWNTGQTWKLFDLGRVSVERYGYPYCTVWRPDLLAVLADAVRRIKPDAIHLGAVCTGFVERPDWQVESWMARGDPVAFARDFTGWHDDVQSMIRNIDEPYQWALASRPPLERWSIGRATLLGDACHPTLPMLAQGAVMALEDGYILARCLRAFDSIDEALQRYEGARLDRTTRIVQGSAENAKRFHNKKLGDAAEAQRFVDTEWAKERVNTRYEWLFRYDVTTTPI